MNSLRYRRNDHERNPEVLVLAGVRLHHGTLRHSVRLGHASRLMADAERMTLDESTFRASETELGDIDLMHDRPG